MTDVSNGGGKPQRKMEAVMDTDGRLNVLDANTGEVLLSERPHDERPAVIVTVDSGVVVYDSDTKEVVCCPPEPAHVLCAQCNDEAVQWRVVWGLGWAYLCEQCYRVYRAHTGYGPPKDANMA